MSEAEAVKAVAKAADSLLTSAKAHKRLSGLHRRESQRCMQARAELLEGLRSELAGWGVKLITSGEGKPHGYEPEENDS